MPTVLAFEPDPKQAAALERIVRDRVGADLVLVESKDQALASMRARIPDLVLLTAFISPRDESDIADLIRESDGAEHTQTLTIPMLDVGSPKPAKKKKRGLLSALTGEAAEAGSPTGCDPALFAEEITNYLQQAAHTRAEADAHRETRAKKPKRKKREPAEPTVRLAAEAEASSPSSSNYWSWDTPTIDSAAEPSAPEQAPPVESAAEPGPIDEAVAAASASTEDADGAAGSSWSNPWDVSASSVLKPEPQVQETYLDDLIIPGPDPFLANGSETVSALFEQPAPPSAAEQLAAPIVLRAEPRVPVVETPAPPVAAPVARFDPPVADETPEPSIPPESDIVLVRLPTRAESATLLALQADVARLRQQRETTDATLVAARAAQERATRAASEAAVRARREADRRAEESAAKAEESAARAKEEAMAERRAREAAEKRAAEEAERRAEAERLARDAAERAREDAARQAKLEADQRIEAERRKAREDAERKARLEAEQRIEAERRKAREEAEAAARREAEARVHAERRAREEAERRAETERLAREQAERRAKEDTARLEREARERRVLAEAERKAREAAEAHAAAERKAREQAERSAREQAERLAREAARKIQEDADEHARKVAADTDRKQKEAEARSREEAATERRARQLAEQRALEERKAREASERRAESERAAREQAEQAAAAAAARAEAAAKPKKASPVRKSKKASTRPEPQPKPRKRPASAPRSVQDEWGLYDPNAAGFEALFAKLESIENGEEEPPAAARRMPRPLAMWAFQLERAIEPAAAPGPESDEFRALVSQFSIPHAVAAVSYAKGARIHKVAVQELPEGAADPDAQVVILSRRLLKEVRRQSSAEPVSARR